MHFGDNNDKHKYYMNGIELEESLCEKDVGVFVSHDLKPSIHCTRAANKANTVLGMMARTFHYRDKVVWINLYKTFVRPHLEYASSAWNPWFVRDIEALEKVQKRAIKMCSGLRGQNYEERLKEVDLDPLFLRRKKIDMIQVWKIINKFDDIEEDKFFERLNVRATRQTRAVSDPLNLRKKDSRLDLRRRFFTNKVIDDWNSIPTEIKSIKKIRSFKNKLNEFFAQ